MGMVRAGAARKWTYCWPSCSHPLQDRAGTRRAIAVTRSSITTLISHTWNVSATDSRESRAGSRCYCFYSRGKKRLIGKEECHWFRLSFIIENMPAKSNKRFRFLKQVEDRFPKLSESKHNILSSKCSPSHHLHCVYTALDKPHLARPTPLQKSSPALFHPWWKPRGLKSRTTIPCSFCRNQTQDKSHWNTALSREVIKTALKLHSPLCITQSLGEPQSSVPELDALELLHVSIVALPVFMSQCKRGNEEEMV